MSGTQAYAAGNLVETIGVNSQPHALVAASVSETIGRNANPNAVVAVALMETLGVVSTTGTVTPPAGTPTTISSAAFVVIMA